MDFVELIFLQVIRPLSGLVLKTCLSCRDRVKKLRDSITKLDKYKEALNSKKRQRSDASIERQGPGGANFVKTGSQNLRNPQPQEVVTQRLEDRTRTVGLNKRVRTSVADVLVFTITVGHNIFV